MSYFAVLREAGPAWAEGGIREQPSVDEHAAFMEALANEGFVVAAGPLAGTETGRVRVLLVIEAEDDAEIRRRLADDPWEAARRIATLSAEPWRVFVGEERLDRAGR